MVLPENGRKIGSQDKPPFPAHGGHSHHFYRLLRLHAGGGHGLVRLACSAADASPPLSPLRKEKVQSVHSRNILFGRDPLTVVFRPVVRNWVYAVYAVLPALPLLFSGWKMPLDSLGNGRNLAEFFLMWISLYAVFTVLTVFLGKARYLKPGRLLLAAGANLALMLLYSLLA